MQDTFSSKASLILGGLLIIAALFASSSTMIEFLLGTSAKTTNELLVGATIFRTSLGILGVAVIALGNMFPWKADIQAEKERHDLNRNLIVAALAGILIAALALRLYALDSGLWLDEIITNVLFARLPSFGAIVTSFESENQHFLYSLLAHASFQVFGESAWALRLPAVLFGIGSIWALYLLGREVAGTREALLAAGLLTFSYTHIWFSQNARGYSGLLFWTILSSWLLLRALRETQPRLWLWYATAAALGVYTHITMVFVLMGHFFIYLGMLVARRNETWTNRWAGGLLGFGFAGLLTLQLYAFVLPQIMVGMGREASVVAEWKNPLWTILEIVKGMQINFAGSITMIGALVVFGAGLLSFARTKPEVLWLLVIPPVIGAVVVIELGHHLWPRFFFFAMGFGALVVIRGAMWWGELGARVLRLPPEKSAWIGTVLCLGLILVFTLSVPSAYGPKQDYQGALAFVEANTEPGDAIATTGLAVFPYKNLYQKDWEEVRTTQALNAIRSRAKRTWLIYTFPPVLKAVYPEIMQDIERDFRTVKEFNGTVGGGTIFVSRSDAPPAGLATK